MWTLRILCVLASLAPAGAAGQAAGNPQPLACAGPFARDTTHDRLVAVFGPANVAFGTVEGPESSEHEATILFSDNPQRRVEVTWHDSAGRARPDAISFSGSGWVAPKGIRVGQTLAVVATLNGAPFRISGFGWDNAGLTVFSRGALARLPGGCRLTIRFAPTVPQPLGERFGAIMGNRQVRSTHPLMQIAKPEVEEIFLSYPR